MPYKDFAVGEVLTSADVDTYLMRQTVMVFDDASARSSALGTVVTEGMLSYRKDGDIVEQYNGSLWSAVGVDSFTTTGTAGNLLVSNGTAGVVWSANGSAGSLLYSAGTAVEWSDAGTEGYVVIANGTAGVTFSNNGTTGQTIISNGTAGISAVNTISPFLLLGV